MVCEQPNSRAAKRQQKARQAAGCGGEHCALLPGAAPPDLPTDPQGLSPIQKTCQGMHGTPPPTGESSSLTPGNRQSRKKKEGEQPGGSSPALTIPETLLPGCTRVLKAGLEEQSHPQLQLLMFMPAESTPPPPTALKKGTEREMAQGSEAAKQQELHRNHSTMGQCVTGPRAGQVKERGGTKPPFCF